MLVWYRAKCCNSEEDYVILSEGIHEAIYTTRISS